MKISISWLKSFIDLKDIKPTELSDLLTGSGLEIEALSSYESVKGNLEGLVIGEVTECTAHPNADKLSLTRVDVGNNNSLPIVCGAPNVASGEKVVVATVGSTLYPSEGGEFKIKKAKIRGEVSEGMICAEDEIGLGNSHEGIIVLDTDLPNGTPASEYFNLYVDQVLEIGLTPNRGDAASHLGVARDLKALLNREIQFPDVSDFKVDNHNLPIEVKIENASACPRYSGLTISNIQVKPSPPWLQNMLSAIGVHPINNVVDITNYVLHELGQPLHAFDADEISGDQVIVKTLPSGSIFTTLDEKERKLTDHDLMICNANDGMCIAGVFGGIKSGVKDKTRNIFLESAYFSPDYIRKTSLQHGLKTDASFRFERGTDPEITVYALKRAALLIKELAGGEISSEIQDVYPNKIPPFEIPASFRHINRLIGKELAPAQIFSILEKLDIEIKDKTKEGFKALAPSYRVDVTREADLIEEILRIYGYDQIEIKPRIKSDFLAEFPLIDPIGIQLQLSQLLAANGFNEIITNSLTKPAYSEKIQKFEPEQNVKILNRLSEDLGVMRQSLLFTGLEVIAYNINHRQKDLKLFEFGKSYQFKDNSYRESTRLSIYLTGAREAENWINPTRNVNFYDLSEIINKILYKFRLTGLDWEPFEDEIFDYGLKITANKKVLVEAAQLKRSALKLTDLEQDVYYAEVDWQSMINASEFNFAVSGISKFPEVRRDLSLVIDKKVTFREIRMVAAKHTDRIIKNITVFDYYVGDNIGSDKKAYALNFTLQDPQKTLTDKVIDQTMSKLMKAYEKELGAIIRK